MENSPYNTPAVPAYGSAGHIPGSPVSQGVLDQLVRTKPWVRLFSVLIFIGAGFMLIAAISMLFLGGLGTAMSAGGPPAGNAAMPALGGAMMIGMSVVYFVLAALYIYPGVKLWKYASRIAALQMSRADLDLEQALNEQRAFWKFAGVSMIVMIILYFVAIAIFMVTAGIAAAKFTGTM